MRPSYLHRLTLRQIEIYRAVCRLRSYSAAAEELSLTQPAVSAQVRQLENLVGEPLLAYVGKRVYLTPAGEVLERAANDLEQRLVATEMELAEVQGTVQGTLGVAAESSAQYFLPGLLGGFFERYPNVSIELAIVNHAQALRRIADNRDEIVIMGLVPDDRALTFVPFRENRLAFVGPAGHPAMGQANLPLAELANETLLVREEGSGTRRVFEDHCQELGVRFSRQKQLGSLEAIKAGVIAGLGNAVLPMDACIDEIAAGKLIQLPANGFPLRRSWCVLHPRARNLTPVGQRLLDFLLEKAPTGIV